MGMMLTGWCNRANGQGCVEVGMCMSTVGKRMRERWNGDMSAVWTTDAERELKGSE